jgi:hypothetical protein
MTNRFFGKISPRRIFDTGRKHYQRLVTGFSTPGQIFIEVVSVCSRQNEWAQTRDRAAPCAISPLPIPGRDNKTLQNPREKVQRK